MRYIKLYEEFGHDEIHDVMMSICDTVSFKESTEFPSTDRVRLYETSEVVKFNPVPYEEYLDGWEILHIENKITFVKGDPKEAALSWLNEIYGDLKPVEDDQIYYVENENEYDLQEFLFCYYKTDLKSKNGYCYISHKKIWSFFESYFGMGYERIQDLVSVWLANTYEISGLTPTIYWW